MRRNSNDILPKKMELYCRGEQLIYKPNVSAQQKRCLNKPFYFSKSAYLHNLPIYIMITLYNTIFITIQDMY